MTELHQPRHGGVLKTLQAIPALMLFLTLSLGVLAALAAAQAGILWLGARLVDRPAGFGELWLLCLTSLVLLLPLLGLIVWARTKSS